MTTTLLTPSEIVDDATRRQFLIGGVAAAGLLIAGCGADAGSSNGSSGGAYPRQVEHADGTASIPAAPKRVACLSPLGEFEALLALGVAPVQIGVRSFFKTYTGSATGLWPWQEDALRRLGAEPDRVSADEPADPETVIRARPDLILGLDYWVEARSQLEAIAPVVVVGSDWRQNLRIVGDAFNRGDEADELIRDTDRRIATALDGLDVAGSTVVVAYPQGDGQVLCTVTPTGPSIDLLTRAGFVVPEALASQGGEFGEVMLSLEELDQIGEVDLLVITAYAPEAVDEVYASEVYQNLPVVRDDRVFVIEQGPEAQAIATFSPNNADVVLPVIREAAELLIARRA